MTSKHIVFDGRLESFGQHYITRKYPIPPGKEFSLDIQERRMRATLFELFLLFDKIALKVGRENLSLFYLIQVLGLDKVEQLLERDVLRLVLWTPLFISHGGIQNADGTFDDSQVLGTPPLTSAHFSEEDSDPEKNLDTPLSKFGFSKARIQSFKKKAIKQYVLPNQYLIENSKDIILGAYLKNTLASLGLKYDKPPEMLGTLERMKLAPLGMDLIVTSFLAENLFKSQANFSYNCLTEEAVKHIESALRVSENTSKILQIRNTPDIQSIVFEERISFDRVFDIRYKNAFKEYRKWINAVSVETDAATISSEYIDELTGKNKFFESNGGKFVKSIGMYAVGASIGAAFGGIQNAAVGAAAGKVAELGLSLFDTYILEGILKGWNPGMFVEKINEEIIRE